ncbi:MAG: hypothetical protein ACI9XO_001166 [Paraglaciecola sp.]
MEKSKKEEKSIDILIEEIILKTPFELEESEFKK